MSLFLLYESASGYALFHVTAADEIATDTEAVQNSVTDFERFSKIVKFEAFKPFTSAADALEQINAVSESQATDALKQFLEMNMPKVGKKKEAKFRLGVADAKLGSAIQEETNVPCEANAQVGELLRGVRLHLTRYIKGLADSDMGRAQLGLAHSYSRAKVKFNVNKVDNMIIQAISLLDTLDKDINTFIMRVREWYSWHFPELVKIVPDNYQYAKVALIVQDKGQINVGMDDKLQQIKEVLLDEDKAQEVIDAAQTSMGQDISPIDLINIKNFANRVISLAEYRHKLHGYLTDKMHSIAPNLSALIGEAVGARLISHAGSLTNLAKYPASTLQILGAEKALFRALKTRGNTPKYGLIFHSTFIGRAKQRNKGRISRYLANKCSIASRIDCFGEVTTKAFGEKMREQVEERLRFYDEGIAPTKNLTAMQEVLKKLQDADDLDEDMADPDAAPAAAAAEEPKKAKKKKKRSEVDDAAAAHLVEEQPKKKKKKLQATEEEEPVKKKKQKAAAPTEAAAQEAEVPKKAKKDKAKKKQKEAA